MKKDRAIFICNTPYQILVALWIKYHTLKSVYTDFIITDHFRGGAEVAKKLSQIGIAENIYYVKSADFCNYKSLTTQREERLLRKSPQKAIVGFFDFNKKYDMVFFANFERFSRLLCAAAKRTNKSLKIVLFEDGIATYSKTVESFYKKCTVGATNNPISKFLSRCYFKDFDLFGNLSYALVFNPANFCWDPGRIISLDKIDCNDIEFVNLVNTVFSFSPESCYDKKYIFMEESYFADKISINDVDLVAKIAESVGKENICVKIHPRNPVNRFAELGYVTNSSTAIPWEVIVMNMPNLSNKILITIASSSILTPILLFDTPIKAFSLYNLVDVQNSNNKVFSLSGDIWELTNSLFKKYNNYIVFCNSIGEITNG